MKLFFILKTGLDVEVCRIRIFHEICYFCDNYRDKK